MSLDSPHSIHETGIFTYIYHKKKKTTNVGKNSSLMYP